MPLADTYSFASIRKPTEIYPAKDSASEILPYNQRDHAFSDEQYYNSSEKSWKADTPNGMPLSGTYAAQTEQKSGQLQFMSIKEALDRFRVETDSKIIPYVVRDHAWNFDHHDKTNFYRYKEDAPNGYKEDMKYITPHPTNQPIPPKIILDIKDKEEADDKADIPIEQARKAKADAKEKAEIEEEKKKEDAEIASEKAASGKAQVNATSAALISANASAKANVTANVATNITAAVNANATAATATTANVSAQSNTTANATTQSNVTANVASQVNATAAATTQVNASANATTEAKSTA